MKIIGGSLRGREIFVPQGLVARPMRNQVREALFHTIADHIPDCVGMDLFAGSGSLGLEAISRGAGAIYFCEKAKPCLAALKRNFRELGVTDRAHVKRLDLARGFDPLYEFGPFDLVLMDPPFDLLRRPPGAGFVDVRNILAELGSSDLLKKTGLIAFEAPARTFRVEPELKDWGLTLEMRREYGSTSLWILKKAGKEC
ncbi:MAG: RsmD family RNA methyltransferase [Planctomycetota bacterium]|nr:RsmD family RNA methyltransferase [Planctomycetota bacterium]